VREPYMAYGAWTGLATAGAVSVLTIALLLTLARASPAGTVPSSGTAFPGASLVYLFDSDSESFVFTFTVPAEGASPRDAIVVPGAGYEDVWFTESGADRIGKLTYTDTSRYVFQDYALPAGSSPSSLTSGGGFIWFTESGKDRIGRLDPETGHLDEFECPAGAYPADLDCASDGSIWFTERMRDRIARLVITSTDDYGVQEYFTASLSGGRPYGIVVAGPSVYFAQTENDQVTRFSPPDTWLPLRDFPEVSDAPNGPYELVLEGAGVVWTTERVGNRITRIEAGTFPLVTPHTLTPTHSVPTGLARDGRTGHLWFTQWAAGQIGRLDPGSGVEYHPLPLPDLAPTGIAVNDSGDVWVLASGPFYVHLPLVMRSGEQSSQ
jgi:virginiamycin B lyase